MGIKANCPRNLIWLSFWFIFLVSVSFSAAGMKMFTTGWQRSYYFLPQKDLFWAILHIIIMIVYYVLRMTYNIKLHPQFTEANVLDDLLKLYRRFNTPADDTSSLAIKWVVSNRVRMIHVFQWSVQDWGAVCECSKFRGLHHALTISFLWAGCLLS